LLNKIIHFNDY
jgi:hypothetical protein